MNTLLLTRLFGQTTTHKNSTVLQRGEWSRRESTTCDAAHAVPEFFFGNELVMNCKLISFQTKDDISGALSKIA